MDCSKNVSKGVSISALLFMMFVGGVSAMGSFPFNPPSLVLSALVVVVGGFMLAMELVPSIQHKFRPSQVSEFLLWVGCAVLVGVLGTLGIMSSISLLFATALRVYLDLKHPTTHKTLLSTSELEMVEMEFPSSPGSLISIVSPYDSD